MSFHVGQKVLAVGLDAEAMRKCIIKNPPSSAQLPEIGEVYTVRQINVWPTMTIILLHELDNSHLLSKVGGRIEPGFNITGFRPVIERKTDISIFTAMLDPSRRKIVETV